MPQVKPWALDVGCDVVCAFVTLGIDRPQVKPHVGGLPLISLNLHVGAVQLVFHDLQTAAGQTLCRWSAYGMLFYLSMAATCLEIRVRINVANRNAEEQSIPNIGAGWYARTISVRTCVLSKIAGDAYCLLDQRKMPQVKP